MELIREYQRKMSGRGTKMGLEIAVCDDCATEREFLIREICGSRYYKSDMTIHEFDAGEKLLDAMEHIAFDAVFLDIQMEGMDGNAAAREIRKRDINLVLAFYTGFAEPSSCTFEVQPYRYLMKNASEEQKQKSVDEVLEKAGCNSSVPLLRASIGRRQLYVKATDIIYIEKYKRHTRVYLPERALGLYQIIWEKDEEYPVIKVQEQLCDIYEQLKRYGFGYPHDSYIINFHFLCACTSQTIQMAGIRSVFPIARSKAKKFHERKNAYFRSKYAGSGTTE